MVSLDRLSELGSVQEWTLLEVSANVECVPNVDPTDFKIMGLNYEFGRRNFLKHTFLLMGFRLQERPVSHTMEVNFRNRIHR